MNTKPDPRCPEHPNIPAIVVPSGNSTHAAALRCPVCDRWLWWLAKGDDRLKNLVFLKPKKEGKQMTFLE
jgi:hypothetical protein